MREYHKINTVFKRDPANNYKTLLEEEFAMAEFAYLSSNEWVFTEKVDGTNIRVMYDGGNLSLGGKTDKAQIPPVLLTRLNEQFLPLSGQFAELFSEATCLYGEGYGAKIQKGGGNYRRDQGFVLFDVRIGDWWLQRPDVETVAEKLGLECVPVIGTGTLYEMVEQTRQGFHSRWGNFMAEGIVARPATELRTRRGDRIITKIKHKDFSAG